ncbi:MAG: Ig-like domain-containing protein [Thermoplasmatota archaeon]
MSASPRFAPILAAAFAVSLVVVALALFAIPSPSFERLARSSGASPALPSADVTTSALGLPTGVTIFVPYPLDVSPTESWNTKWDLLDLTVNTGAIPASVAATINGPNGRTTTTLPGVLSISGDPTSDFTVAVTNGGTTTLSAHLVASSSPGSVEVKAVNGQTNLDFKILGDLCLLYDPVSSQLKSLELCDPLAKVTGVPSGFGVTPVTVPDVLSLAPDTGSLLGQQVPLGGASFNGDPLAPGGATLKDASGATLATVAVSQPTGAVHVFKVDVDGPIVATLVDAVAAKDPTGKIAADPSASHLTLLVNADSLPLGLVALGWGGADYDAVGLFSTLLPGSGVPEQIVGVWNTLGANAPVATTLTTAWGSYTPIPAPLTLGLGATPTGLTIHGSSATGSIDASVPLGVDPQLVSLDSSGLGIPSTDAAVSTLTGLVANWTGSLPSPSSFSLATPGDLPFVKFSQDASGASVTWAGYSDKVPGGSLRVDGDPTSFNDYTISLMSGSPVASATVHREPTLGNAALGLPTVTVQAQDQSLTLAPPVAIRGDLTSGTVNGLKVWSPIDPSVVLVDLENGAAGWSLTTPFASQTLPAAPASLVGNPLTGSTVALDVGSGALTLAADRSTGLVTIGGSAVPAQQVNGPLALAGNPASPSGVGLTDPSTGKSLLLYTMNADGTGSLAVMGNTTAKDTRFLTLRGDPRSASGFSIVLTGTDGETVESTDTISLAAIAKDYNVPPAVADPILSILGGGADAPHWVADAMDGHNNVAMHDELASGSAYLSATGPHSVLLAIPSASDAYSHMSLRAARNGAPGDAAMAFAFTPYGTAGDLHLYKATMDLSALGAHDGDSVRFTVRYDHDVSPFVADTVDETNGGSGYAFFVDGVAPTASIASLEAPTGTVVGLGWTAHDGGAGVASYDVQWSADGATWHDLAMKTPDTSAQFTGEAGKTYDFRARATDAVGNVGDWSTLLKVTFPAATGGSGSGNDTAPTVAFTAPAAGALLTGKATVSWTTADADGTKPIVILYESPDAGATWHVLYSGSAATSYAWDTAKLGDGSYSLKVTATDGILATNATLGPLTLKNAPSEENGFANATAPTLPVGGGQGSPVPTNPGGNTGGLGGDTGSGASGAGAGSGVSSSTAMTLILVGVIAILAGGFAVLWYVRR